MPSDASDVTDASDYLFRGLDEQLVTHLLRSEQQANPDVKGCTLALMDEGQNGFWLHLLKEGDSQVIHQQIPSQGPTPIVGGRPGTFADYLIELRAKGIHLANSGEVLRDVMWILPSAYTEEELQTMRNKVRQSKPPANFCSMVEDFNPWVCNMDRIEAEKQLLSCPDQVGRFLLRKGGSKDAVVLSVISRPGGRVEHLLLDVGPDRVGLKSDQPYSKSFEEFVKMYQGTDFSVQGMKLRLKEIAAPLAAQVIWKHYLLNEEEAGPKSADTPSTSGYNPCPAGVRAAECNGPGCSTQSGNPGPPGSISGSPHSGISGPPGSSSWPNANLIAG